jgi:hypothetical protein
MVHISRRFIKNTRVLIFGKTDRKHSEQENNCTTQETIIQTYTRWNGRNVGTFNAFVDEIAT